MNLMATYLGIFGVLKSIPSIEMCWPLVPSSLVVQSSTVSTFFSQVSHGGDSLLGSTGSLEALGYKDPSFVSPKFLSHKNQGLVALASCQISRFDCFPLFPCPLRVCFASPVEHVLLLVIRSVVAEVIWRARHSSRCGGAVRQSIVS